MHEKENARFILKMAAFFSNQEICRMANISSRDVSFGLRFALVMGSSSIQQLDHHRKIYESRQRAICHLLEHARADDFETIIPEDFVQQTTAQLTIATASLRKLCNTLKYFEKSPKGIDHL